MKAKGITGKGCYKAYFYIPKWFYAFFRRNGNSGSLLNVAMCENYLGFGFDKKTKTWDSGVFLTDFEMALPFWKRKAAEADFIIHLRGEI
jgi:hypothetical protein